MIDIDQPHTGQVSPAQSRDMSYGESRTLIRHRHEGRLAYLSGRGPRSVAINYAVTDDQILFLVPSYNEITQYVPGMRVTLLVDQDGTAPASRPFDTVRIKGTAQLAGTEQASTVERTSFPETWPRGVSTSIIYLPMGEIRGSRREPPSSGSAATGSP